MEIKQENDIQQQQVHQQQQQPQMMQIRLAPQISTSGSTKTHDTAVLTLPSNIGNIVSINSNFLTNDLVGNYKIDL